MTRDWDKELAKIDKQLASISDEELMQANAPPAVAPPAKGRAAAAPGKAPAVTAAPTPRRWTVYLRLGLALAMSVAIGFWPHDTYSIACGVNLFLYLGASAAIAGAGIWSAIWSWRHRAGAAHVLSLGVMMWGLVVGASEVLPRVGYAVTQGDTPPAWFCE